MIKCNNRTPNNRTFMPNIICFNPRNAMLAQVIGIATCLSVRLSIRPSHAGIVSKRRKLES